MVGGCEGLLYALERLRDERETLTSVGKRTYAELGPWIAAEGVLKRAKSAW